jgi:hypothetical protein
VTKTFVKVKPEAFREAAGSFTALVTAEREQKLRTIGFWKDVAAIAGKTDPTIQPEWALDEAIGFFGSGGPGTIRSHRFGFPNRWVEFGARLIVQGCMDASF